MLKPHNTQTMGSCTNLCQLFTRNVNLSSIHKLDYVRNGISLQFQTKILQSKNDRSLDILFTQLIFEELAAGGHDDLVDVDVMVFTDYVKVDKTCLQTKLLELLAKNPAVVLHQDAHRCNGPCAHGDRCHVQGHVFY